MNIVPKNWIRGDILRDEDQAGKPLFWSVMTNVDSTVIIEVAQRMGMRFNREWNDPRGKVYRNWLATLNL